MGSPAPLVSTSAEVEDLGILADELGIGFAEAEARYAGQELFAAVVDQARRDDAQHFSSARWTPGESVSAAISFVGKPSDEVVAALAGLPFEVRVSEAGAMTYCRLFSSNPSTLMPGDSGGPWYWGNAGKGLSEGYQTNMLGLRLYDLATQIGAHSYLVGLAVKIAP